MPLSWLWPSILPFGKITALASAPGEGKSLLALDLAARITTGRPLPDGTPAPQGSVLLLSAEDDPEDTILPRFLTLGGDPAKLHQTTTLRNPPSSLPPSVPSCLRASVPSSPNLFSLAQHAALDDYLTAHPDIRLVILDPLPAFLGRDAGHSPKSQANLRNHLNALTALARKHHIAILALTPARPQPAPKRSASPISTLRSLPSTLSSLLLPQILKDFLRTIWLLRRDPNHPTRRVLVPAKTNLTAPPEHLFTFDLTDQQGYPTLTWHNPAAQSGTKHQEPSTSNKEPSPRGSAVSPECQTAQDPTTPRLPQPLQGNQPASPIAPSSQPSATPETVTQYALRNTSPPTPSPVTEQSIRTTSLCPGPWLS